MSWTNAISRCSVKSSPDTFSIGKATSSRVSTGSVAAAHPEGRQDFSVGPSIDDGVAKPVTCADRDLRHQQHKDETEPVHCTALPGSWAASMAHAFSIEDRGLRPYGLEMSPPANTWSCAVGCWVRGNVPLEPNRSMEQLGRNLRDWVDPRHFGRLHDARALGCFTDLGRLEELARPGRVLGSCQEDEIVGFVAATEDPRRGSRVSAALSSPLSSRGR